ncbi:Epithelial splicing regulatory protein 1-like [Oopsacas minuta]|uniref:Epithelial splicing regulatory protein 1-like n=1 Tax=Oopsacas minuta TaxID=111878 RepID=A0AAV7K1P8_9METZ|nr:Epithelial splicing regulatory protein 1-like [Oopsacas minuta]
MSRKDNLFDEYNIVDDNPDLHPDDNFFMKSPPAVKFELDDELMEVRQNDEFDHNDMSNSFPTEVNPDDIIENIVRFYSLSYGVDETEIVSVFQSDIPDLSPDDAIIIKPSSGKHTCTAFLNLGSKEEVQAVLRHNGSMLRGKSLMMMPSTEREIQKCQDHAERNDSIRSNPVKSGHNKGLTQIRTQCIHMKGVCLTSNHNAIRRFFEPIRIPSQSVFLIPRQSGASSLEVYVQFREIEDCERALTKHRCDLDGNEVDVYSVTKNKMLEAIEEYGVLDKGPNYNKSEYVGSDIIDARLRARQEILKERGRIRSRSPVYRSSDYHRSSLLSRDRDSDALSRLQEIDLLRDRDRRDRDRDRYSDKDRKYDIDRKELSSMVYGSKRDRIGDSLQSRYYSREDDRDLESRRYSSRDEEYRQSPHSKRFSRRSPYSDRLPASTSRSRDLGSYSTEFSKNPIVRLTGLSSETLIYDIMDFFHGFELKIDSIRIQCNDYGAPNGKAFVRFPSFSQAMLAIDQCKGKELGSSRSLEMSLI